MQHTRHVVMGQGNIKHIFRFIAPFELDENRLFRRFFGYHDSHILLKLYYFNPPGVTQLEIVFVAEGCELPTTFELPPEFRVVLTVNTELLQPIPDNPSNQARVEDYIDKTGKIQHPLVQQEDYFLAVLGDLEYQLNQLAPKALILSLSEKLNLKQPKS